MICYFQNRLDSADTRAWWQHITIWTNTTKMVKMGTSASFERMVRNNKHTPHTWVPVYQHLAMKNEWLTSKKKVFYFPVTTSLALTKALLICVCRVLSVCIYDVCFLTDSTNHKYFSGASCVSVRGTWLSCITAVYKTRLPEVQFGFEWSTKKSFLY